MTEFDYEQSTKNLRNGCECQSCPFDRVLCILEGKCLLELEKEYIKVLKD